MTDRLPTEIAAQKRYAPAKISSAFSSECLKSAYSYDISATRKSTIAVPMENLSLAILKSRRVSTKLSVDGKLSFSYSEAGHYMEL